MLKYALERLSNYEFQNSDFYKDKFDGLEGTFYCLVNDVNDLITGVNIRNETFKTNQCFKNLNVLMNELSKYEGIKNKKNKQYVNLMLLMLQHHIQTKELIDTLSLIDIL